MNVYLIAFLTHAAACGVGIGIACLAISRGEI